MTFLKYINTNRARIRHPNRTNRTSRSEAKKSNNALGPNDVTAEMLKMGGEQGVKALWEVCNKIWFTGEWPKNWAESLFILLRKKGQTENCSNYCTISFISHTSKVLNVIYGRLR